MTDPWQRLLRKVVESPALSGHGPEQAAVGCPAKKGNGPDDLQRSLQPFSDFETV